MLQVSQALTATTACSLPKATLIMVCPRKSYTIYADSWFTS